MLPLWSTRNALQQADVSASSQAAGLPLSDAIVNEHLGTVWRALARSFSVDADFNGLQRLRTFGMFGTTLTPLARLRILLSNVAPGGGEVYDSRETVAAPYVADDDAPYLADDDAPYEADLVVDLIANVEPGFGQWVHVLPEALHARYLRIEVEDETNPLDFVDIGMVWAGDGFEMDLNMLPGDGAGTDDPSLGRITGGGQSVINLERRVRFYRGSHDFLSQAQAFGELQDMTRTGSQDNVLFVPDPASPWINREAVLGLIQKSVALPFTTFREIGFGFEIRERL